MRINIVSQEESAKTLFDYFSNCKTPSYYLDFDTTNNLYENIYSFIKDEQNNNDEYTHILEEILLNCKKYFDKLHIQMEEEYYFSIIENELHWENVYEINDIIFIKYETLSDYVCNKNIDDVIKEMLFALLNIYYKNNMKELIHILETKYKYKITTEQYNMKLNKFDDIRIHFFNKYTIQQNNNYFTTIVVSKDTNFAPYYENILFNPKMNRYELTLLEHPILKYYSEIINK